MATLIRVKKSPASLIAGGFRAREEGPEAARQFEQDQQKEEPEAPEVPKKEPEVRMPTDDEFRKAGNVERNDTESKHQYRQRVIDAASQADQPAPSEPIQKATIKKLKSPVKKPEEEDLW